jgi:pilus assembly protein Flp/PilA
MSLYLNTFSNISRQSGARLNRQEKPMRAFFTKLIRDESGVTAVEYGLIAALIAVAAVTVMSTVGTNLSSTFSKVASSL